MGTGSPASQVGAPGPHTQCSRGVGATPPGLRWAMLSRAVGGVCPGTCRHPPHMHRHTCVHTVFPHPGEPVLALGTWNHTGLGLGGPFRPGVGALTQHACEPERLLAAPGQGLCGGGLGGQPPPWAHRCTCTHICPVPPTPLRHALTQSAWVHWGNLGNKVPQGSGAQLCNAPSVHCRVHRPRSSLLRSPRTPHPPPPPPVAWAPAVSSSIPHPLRPALHPPPL